MKYLKQPATIIGIALTIIFGILCYTNDYMEYKDRKCVVLDKLITSRRSTDFWLVLKEERGIVFDLIVSPATYSQASVGETIHFNIRQMDIKQTTKDNIIYFFSVPIICMLAVMSLGVGFITAKQSYEQ